MEHELTEKVRSLYDAREIQTEINETVLTTLARMEAKIDTLQMETSNIHRIK
jgi:hypothetical protein